MIDPTLTDLLLTPILGADPAGPRVTYYDDATGERQTRDGRALIDGIEITLDPGKERRLTVTAAGR